MSHNEFDGDDDDEDNILTSITVTKAQLYKSVKDNQTLHVKNSLKNV
jgi:hypothetical protein